MTKWGALRGAFVAATAALAALAATPVAASALTLGSLDPATTDPGTGGDCVGANGHVLQDSISPSSPDYVVPDGGGTITSWSTKWGIAGHQVSLEVWRSVASTTGEYTLEGLDSETLAPAATGVSTYTLSAPIAVQGGDVLGIGWSAATTVDCGYQAPLDADTNLFKTGVSPTVGSDVIFITNILRERVNVEVNLSQTADLAISQTTNSTKVVAGNPVDFLLTISDGGPSPTTATVTDALPAGLRLFSVVASGGSCSGAQTVSCQLPLPVGGSETVSLVAIATAPGTQTNTATVSSSASDATPADNRSSVSVQVISIPALGHVSKHRKGHAETFRFTLDQPAAITVRVERKGTTVRTLGRSGHAGSNTINVKGLVPGHYKAIITASDAAGTSNARTVEFTIP